MKGKDIFIDLLEANERMEGNDLVEIDRNYQRLLKKLLHLQLKKPNKESPEYFALPNQKVIDQYHLMESWWAYLDPLSLKEVKARPLSKFLIAKGILRKELELDRILKEVINDSIRHNVVKQS